MISGINNFAAVEKANASAASFAALF